MLFHPSWHTSIPSLCLAITTHLKIYFTWFSQPKIDHNDTEYSMCFINSERINTLAGNLSVFQSYASLNFTVITVDSLKFRTLLLLEKHFKDQEKLRGVEAACSGVCRWCLICTMQAEHRLFCLCVGRWLLKCRLPLSKGHTDNIQTSLENRKCIHQPTRLHHTLTIIACKLRNRWHLDIQRSLENRKSIHLWKRFQLPSNALTIRACQSRNRWHLDSSPIFTDPWINL